MTRGGHLETVIRRLGLFHDVGAVGGPDAGGSRADILARAAILADALAAGAADLDHEGALPEAAMRSLADAGLLAVPLARARGGDGLGTEAGRTSPLLALLKLIGRGNLSIGRIYEGHVNALQLVETFGTPEQAARLAGDARDRRQLFGVWNTEAADGVRLIPLGHGRYGLEGAKTFASGAGLVERPIVTGALPDGGKQMCVVPMECVTAVIDPSWWRPIGMRASASYRVALDGIEIGPDALLGHPGDYYRQPWFGGGAIRFAAVQLGGAEALLDAARAELLKLGRDRDQRQRARIGEATIAVESGNLWLRGAAELADRSTMTLGGELRGRAGDDGLVGAPSPCPLPGGEGSPSPPGRGQGEGHSRETEAVVSYANMTRLAIERICLDVMRLVERSVGARGLFRPHPIERITRDLTLYLRQPFPDDALDDVGRYSMATDGPVDRLWAGDSGAP